MVCFSYIIVNIPHNGDNKDDDVDDDHNNNNNNNNNSLTHLYQELALETKQECN